MEYCREDSVWEIACPFLWLFWAQPQRAQNSQRRLPRQPPFPRAQFVKWEVYREGERVADGLSFTVYRTGQSPSAKATCVGESTTFRERLFP